MHGRTHRKRKCLKEYVRQIIEETLGAGDAYLKE